MSVRRMGGGFGTDGEAAGDGGGFPAPCVFLRQVRIGVRDRVSRVAIGHRRERSGVVEKVLVLLTRQCGSGGRPAPCATPRLAFAVSAMRPVDR